MHKTMVYLSERQRAALARQGRRRREPMAAMIREAVDRWLADVDGRPASRLVGVGAGPETAPVSERVEELLKTHLRRRRPR
jgi:hypothetical protein